jgi:hypothetical protein
MYSRVQNEQHRHEKRNFIKLFQSLLNVTQTHIECLDRDLSELYRKSKRNDEALYIVTQTYYHSHNASLVVDLDRYQTCITYPPIDPFSRVKGVG